MAIIQGTPRDAIRISYCLEEEIGEDNPVRIIDLIVELVYHINPEIFDNIDNKNAESGRGKYSSRIMTKLLLYSYSQRIKGSRKIEEESHRNIDLKWLINELTPDHWTISNFRKNNGNLILMIKQKFTEILKSNSYINGKEIVIDGSKIKAYAGRNYYNKTEIKKWLNKNETELKKYIQDLEIIDKNEDEFESRQKELEDKIKELQKEMAAKDEELSKFTGKKSKWIVKRDEGSRLIKSRDGFIPGYNVQVSTDNHFIIENIVTSETGDDALLIPTIEKTEEAIKEKVETVVADKGYYNYKNLIKLETKEITSYIPIAKSKKEEIEFRKAEGEDKYICSQGQDLVFKQRNVKKKNYLANLYVGVNCNNCPLKSKCTTSTKGRYLYINVNSEIVEQLKRRLSSPEGKIKIKERKTKIEHIFGTLKLWMGKMPLHLRSKYKVSIEINIWQIVYNLRRLIGIEGVLGVSKLFTQIMKNNNKTSLKTT
ncbi:MAG: IS1182 family transposase [bacterium]